jgi:hypothetical protein
LLRVDFDDKIGENERAVIMCRYKQAPLHRVRLSPIQPKLANLHSLNSHLEIEPVDSLAHTQKVEINIAVCGRKNQGLFFNQVMLSLKGRCEPYRQFVLGYGEETVRVYLLLADLTIDSVQGYSEM